MSKYTRAELEAARDAEQGVIQAVQQELRTRGRSTPSQHRDRWIEGPSMAGWWITLIVVVVGLCVLASKLPWSW